MDGFVLDKKKKKFIHRTNLAHEALCTYNLPNVSMCKLQSSPFKIKTNVKVTHLCIPMSICSPRVSLKTFTCFIIIITPGI